MKFALIFNGVIAWLFAAVYCANANGDLAKLKGGVDAGKAILDVIADDKFSTVFSQVGKIAGYLGPFLGALGPALSFTSLFFDSPELQFMKKEFAKIDANFNKVFSEIREVKALIEEGSLKNHYFEHEQTILSLSEELQHFLNASGKEKSVFNRSFVAEYESSEKKATYTLWVGMMGSTVLSYNIPAKVMSYTKNHRRRTQTIMKGVLNLILQGVKIELSYLTALGMEVDFNTRKDYWEKKIKELLDYMQVVDYEVKQKWYPQTGDDVKSMLREKQGKRNSDFADAMYNFLTEKYDWRHWHVVAYKPKTGHEYHWIYYRNGYHYFRTNGRNMVVASVGKKKYNAIDLNDTRSILKRTSTTCCRKKSFIPSLDTNNCDSDTAKTRWWGPKYECGYRRYAKDIFQNKLPKKLFTGWYDSVGVIMSNLDVQHRGPTDRLVVVQNGNFKLHAFG